MERIQIVLAGLPALMGGIVTRIFAARPDFQVIEIELDELPALIAGRSSARLVVGLPDAAASGNTVRRLFEMAPELVILLPPGPSSGFQLWTRSATISVESERSGDELAGILIQMLRLD